jgi:hypothetical protein
VVVTLERTCVSAVSSEAAAERNSSMVAAPLEETTLAEEEFSVCSGNTFLRGSDINVICDEADSAEDVEITTPRESTAGGRPVPTVVAIVFVAGTGVPVTDPEVVGVP